MAKEPDPIKKTKAALERGFDNMIKRLGKRVDNRGRLKLPMHFERDTAIAEIFDNIETRAQAMYALQVGGDYSFSVDHDNYVLRKVVAKNGRIFISIERVSRNR